MRWQALARRVVTLAGLMVIAPLVRAECMVSVIGLSFGSYDTFSLTDTDITGNISVTCDTGTTAQVSLGAGLGDFLARQMKQGADSLFYNLFTDVTRSTIWGDGSAGTAVQALSGTSASFTVYGRIPARQNVQAGAYSDTITVTLTF